MLLKYFIYMWDMYILIYAVACNTIVLKYISLYVSVAMPHPAATANHVVHKLSFASCFTYLTQYATPHRSIDVGGAPSLSLKYESWLLMPI